MQLRAKEKASLGSIQRSAAETSSRVVVFEHESFQEAKKRTKNQNKIQIYSTAEKSLVGKHEALCYSGLNNLQNSPNS